LQPFGRNDSSAGIKYNWYNSQPTGLTVGTSLAPFIALAISLAKVPAVVRGVSCVPSDSLRTRVRRAKKGRRTPYAIRIRSYRSTLLAGALTAVM
jgi:hypothetical protein